MINPATLELVPLHVLQTMHDEVTSTVSLLADVLVNLTAGSDGFELRYAVTQAQYEEARNFAVKIKQALDKLQPEGK